MESLPLIPKSKIIPNSDVTSLIREIFQTELESYVPSKKLSENLRKSLEYEKIKEDVEGQKSFRSVHFLENLPDEKRKLMDYAEKVLEAYVTHEEALNRITKVELNIMETQAIYLRKEETIKKNDFLRDLLKLKKRPLMKCYNPEYVKEYKLLQGDSGLPAKHEAEIDFRIKDYQLWKEMSIHSEDNLLPKCPDGTNTQIHTIVGPKKFKKAGTNRPKRTKFKKEGPNLEVFRAEPRAVCFTDYLPGYVYSCRVTVRNMHTKPMKFVLKPLSMESPFKVEIYGTETTRILPGLSFKLLITFEPRCLEDNNENVIISIEDGSRLIIPLASYLEPPVLKISEGTPVMIPAAVRVRMVFAKRMEKPFQVNRKGPKRKAEINKLYLFIKAHEDIDECTKNIKDKIRSSYIECGACFPGDSKITKIRFYSFGGAGEFFLMSQDNWNNWHVDCLTPDNFTDLPPFRLYPTYFKLDKNQVIDLYVEFKPLTFGLHSDNIVIACSNGEVRNIDVLGDGVAWNRSFINFEESLEKDFRPHINDDHRVVYYLDMGSTLSGGRTERTFCITNNSNMPFEFRWEMRDINVPFRGQEELGKLLRTEVKIEPCSQIFEPYTSRIFTVSVNFQKRPVGRYRTVLSLYIIGLPYQSIEQRNTIIRPSVLRRRFKSSSELGEEDNPLLSPEFSYQDTYESIQEGMKTSGEIKRQQQFPTMVCRKHPEICAIPLKRSKTSSNINGSIGACTCGTTRTPEAVESVKNCENDSSPRRPNITELGSDLLWDFVDVLVDEIELWAEVVPTIVTIEPWIVNLYDNVRLNKPPVHHDVYIHNHNNTAITCKWLKSIGKQEISSEVSNVKVSALRHIQGLNKNEEHESLNATPEYGEDEEWDHISGDSTVSTTPDDYQITCYATQKGCTYSEMIADVSANKYCDINVYPNGCFRVQPNSRYKSLLSISATEPGIINIVLNLIIMGEEPMQLRIIGRVPDREISIFPQILDFGVRRTGARYTKHFKIKNENKDPVEWKVEQYSFNYSEQILIGPIQEELQGSLMCLKGTLEENGCTVESYKLDARKPGLKTNILKFDVSNPAYGKTRSRYLVVLADVQTPKLAIEAPRFDNAILAPSRTMYFGQMITQNIILRNMKNVATTFIWGYPFGCHCRKLKIDIKPKLYVVEGLKNVVVQVNITPMEEVRRYQLPRIVNGIVEHCYIPCFFSRNVNPVLLSIVGVIENARVMFELSKENLHPCNTDAEEKASVMKVAWPIRNFDPTIGMNYIIENKILDFICHCEEVDLEYTRNTGFRTKNFDEGKIHNENEKEFNCLYEEYDEKEEEEKEECSQEIKQACVRKYYTPTRMKELRNKILQEKGITFDIEDEIVGEGDERNRSLMSEADTDSGTVIEYPKRECIDLLYYAASELQFLNMVYKTSSVKHFVIRNLTPISINFSLKVKYFSRVDHTVHRDKIQEIRNRVAGRQKDEFEDSMIYGQPLLITTSPTEGTLEGWQSLRISVFAYGNTWGEYRDFIICDVSGMPPYVIKVFVQLSGHPVLFPMFKASLLDIPVLRFNAVKYKSKPVLRNIRVQNTSSIPITVTWIVFLISPISNDTKEEPFSLCLDLYTDKESEDPDKMTKSSHNYLSKNTSGSVPFFDGIDTEKSNSHSTGNDRMSEMDSGKKNSSMRRGRESDLTPKSVSDSTKPEIQLLENFGKVDLHVFQISPRELDLEPYSEQKITITFDPNAYDQTTRLQDYEAVVTGCVRLQQEYAHYPNLYQRSCGRDYVSKLLYLSVNVEKPLLHFEVSKNDLKYTLNANEVVKAKEFRKLKKYMIRNQCQTPVSVLVKLDPGEIFSIKRICSRKNKLSKDNPVTIEPGSFIEIYLEMSVTLSQIVDMFKLFAIQEPKKRKATMAKSSDLIIEGVVLSDSKSSEEKVSGRDSKHFDVESGSSSYSSYGLADPDSKFLIKPLDSFIMTENRSRRQNSVNKVGETVIYNFKKRETEECYGESLEMSSARLRNSESDGKMELSYIVEEDLVFEQVGLTRQVLTPKLHVYFPLLKLNPEVIDFGRTYIGETSRRYASLINLTQFPTIFAVTSSGGSNDFLVYPNLGYLPATNYKSDTGVELAVEFTPNEPGYFTKTFKIYGNKEMEFEFFVLTVLGFGTWNEKYKYPRIESQSKSQVLPFLK